jgi:hypothetical protein
MTCFTGNLKLFDISQITTGNASDDIKRTIYNQGGFFNVSSESSTFGESILKRMKDLSEETEDGVVCDSLRTPFVTPLFLTFLSDWEEIPSNSCPPKAQRSV